MKLFILTYRIKDKMYQTVNNSNDLENNLTMINNTDDSEIISIETIR